MTENIDALIAESQRIRDDMLRTVGKLEAFSANLMVEAERLRNEVTTSNARDHASEVEQAQSASGDPEGKHAETEG